MDTPAWWNMGHRPVKFVDGVFPMDAPRVDMVFYTPFFGLFGSLGGPISEAGQDWMRENGPDAEHLDRDAEGARLSRGRSNTALAEQGAVLFHTLDLWATSRNNPVPRPAEGQRLVRELPRRLRAALRERPQLPRDAAARGHRLLHHAASDHPDRSACASTPTTRRCRSPAPTTSSATRRRRARPNDCGPQNRADLRGNRELGYLAPPLYGVWATAPYLHNGSVPNVWEVLKPADRKPLWQRKSKAPRWDQTGRVIMGYDTEHGGLRHREARLEVRRDPVPEPVAAQPVPVAVPALQSRRRSACSRWYDEILTALYSNVILAWNMLFPPTITNTDIENRKIFNAYMFGQGNGGHTLQLGAHRRGAQGAHRVPEDPVTTSGNGTCGGPQWAAAGACSAEWPGCARVAEGGGAAAPWLAGTKGTFVRGLVAPAPL